jgi:hypothetical protein
MPYTLMMNTPEGNSIIGSFESFDSLLTHCEDENIDYTAVTVLHNSSELEVAELEDVPF